MRKLLIICMVSTILCLTVNSVRADPNLCFDFDNDGVCETSWIIDGTETVEIYLDDWDTSPFSSEPLIGVQMFFYYDDTRIQVNEEYSFANDTNHGGEFNPSYSTFFEIAADEIKLIVAKDNCLEIVDKVLLWTLELQSVAGGISDMYVQVDYPNKGFVGVGGESCPADSHEEDVGSGYVEITTTSIPTPIPTLSEWGIVCLVIVMMGVGTVILRRKEVT